MIILNINEINEIDSRRNFSNSVQPRDYNSEEELIEWIKFYLFYQYRCKHELTSEKLIKIEPNDEYDYIIRIGVRSHTTIISFDFNFHSLISMINHVVVNNNITCCNFLFEIENVIFEDDVIFENIYFNNTVRINNAYCKNKVNFNNIDFNDDLYFKCIDYVNFNDDLYFEYPDYVNPLFIFYKQVEFKNTKFNKNFYLKNIEFRGEFNIYNSYINNLQIENSTIKEIYLLNSIINKNIFITNNTFNIINNAYNLFFKNVSLITESSSINILGDLKIKEKVEDYHINISLENISSKGSIFISNINFNIINFNNLITEHFIYDFEFKEIKNSSTARILKNEELKKSNTIKALEYQAEEVRLHKEELLQKWSENKNLKTFGDIISINLSSLFSDNGVNWIKALAMTIVSTFVLFTIFYFPDLPTIMRMVYKNDYSLLCNYFYKDFFEDFIRYIIPTEYDLLFNYAKSSTPINFFIKIFGVITYFTGKIAFWYGSFHTVSAFRKFNRSL